MLKFGRLVCAIAARLSLVFGVAAFAARSAEAGSLPADYTAVDCLISHGTEYINTEYAPTKNCRIVLDFAYATDTDKGGTVLGFGASGNAQSIRLFREKDASTGVVSYRVNFDDNYGDICYVNCGEGLDTDRHTFDVSNASKTLDGLEIDGVYYEPGKPTDNKILLTKTLEGPLYLFAFDRGWNPVGSAADPATCKIYSCQIYDGTTLVRDFVPCLNANEEPVLYDLAGQKAYANKGGGKFECEVSSPFVEATLTGCRVAADGQAHGPVLTVTEPASGYQVEWSTDGVTYTSERPTFTDPGEYPVFCRISADGYTARSLRATVLIGYVRRIVATEAEQTGDWADATVAGDDAWAAIQGVIDGCGVSDLILVKAGSYLLTNELAFASDELRGVTLRSDDGEGNLARKTTLLVGGYPATSNRLVRIATPEVIVEGFTLTNGFVNAAPGGGAYLDNCGAGAGLRSCDIVGCTAWHEPYLTSDVGFSNGAAPGTGGGAYVKTTGCISNCLFKSNVSFAGAVSLYGTQNVLCPPKDTPWVTHCEFVWNEQIGKGTANNCNGSAVASRCACCIDHCSIVSNFCNVTSGVQISTVGSNSGYLIISNCVFRSNGLGKRKDMLFKTNSPSTIRCVGNTFIEEVANPILGSIDSWGCDGISMFYCAKALGSTNVKNSFFYGNTNSDGCVSGACTVQNCTFVGNRGAIYSNGGAAVASRTNRVVNCVFYGNVDDIYAVNDGNAKPIALFVSNCCIRASSLDQKVGSNRQFGLLVTNGCNIVYGGGNMDLMTLGFVAPSQGDFRLREGSLLVDAGMTLNWMDGASDGNGLPRVVGLAPDIGCYERQEGAIDPPKSFVRAVAKEEDKKGEWAEAYVGLQAAADAACGETVYVKAGAYDLLEPVSLRNFGVVFVGEGPGKTIVDGGYPTRTNRLFTITQGGIQIKGMTLQNSAVAADGGAILVSHDDFTLDSCVVSNCCAGFEGSSETARYGGGVYVDSVYGNVLLTNTLFVSCAARLGGGVAVWKKDTSLSAWATRATVPVVSDCEFVADRVYAVGKDDKSGGRTGHGQGAGAFGSLWVEHSRFCGNFTKPTDNYASALTLDSYGIATNCLFENHLSGECATVAGRGDGTGGAKALITQCTFRGNSVPYLLMGHAIVENCQVVSNAFTLSTALDARENSTFKNMLFAYNTGVFGVGKLTYENCTFVTNEFGICVYVHNKAPTLRNCVSYGNTGTVSRISGTHRGTADFCYERGWSGSRPGTYANDVVLGCWKLPIYKNNREDEFFAFADLDPSGATSNIIAAVEKKGFKFVDPAKGNWRLRRNSPLRDAALPLDWMTEVATDLDGKPRRISSDGKSYPDSLPDIGCYECDIPKPGFLLMVW